jgi:ketosteroid isomerase-like protein
MTTASNKQLLEHIFSELAKGNARPLVESMADDFSWTVTGATEWSRKYAGKQVVLKELLGNLRDRLAPPIITVAHRFIADGDLVAVEARGANTTKDGRPYANTYCFVFRLAEGKLQEVTEYLDTELVTAAFGDPAI